MTVSPHGPGTVRGFLVAVVSCIAVLITAAGIISPVKAATAYYVSTSGNDGAAGTTTETAWKSLDKVNSASFGAGDTILFRCTDTWHGRLFIHNSGASGSPITVGSYGAGDKPLINGGGGDAAVFLDNVTYVIVEGLQVTNYGGGDIRDGDEANRDGIKITGGGNIIIRNNEVYNVEGFSNNHNANPAYPPRGTSLPPKDNNMYLCAAIYQNGACSPLTIENNYVHDNTGTGILATDAGANLVIRGNTVNNAGADGIEFWNTTGALVERNSVIFCGNNSGAATQGSCIGAAGLAVCAIWGFQSSGMVQQYNYAERTQRIIYDGQAWDFDIGTSGGVYQYNYSRENEGGFILGGGQICRYNISYNDGTDEYHHHYGTREQGFFGSTNLYNNTFYQDNRKGFTFSNGFSGEVKNNVFYTNCTDTRYTTYAGNLSNNCFAGGQTAVNKGSNALSTDPMFVNPSAMGRSINECDGLKLQSGSPCIDAGAAIPANGGKDFFGTILYSGGPDIGAHEYTTPTGVAVPEGRRTAIPGRNPGRDASRNSNGYTAAGRSIDVPLIRRAFARIFRQPPDR